MISANSLSENKSTRGNCVEFGNKWNNMSPILILKFNAVQRIDSSSLRKTVRRSITSCIPYMEQNELSFDEPGSRYMWRTKLVAQSLDVTTAALSPLAYRSWPRWYRPMSSGPSVTSNSLWSDVSHASRRQVKNDTDTAFRFADSIYTSTAWLSNIERHRYATLTQLGRRKNAIGRSWVTWRPTKSSDDIDNSCPCNSCTLILVLVFRQNSLYRMTSNVKCKSCWQQISSNNG